MPLYSTVLYIMSPLHRYTLYHYSSGIQESDNLLSLLASESPSGTSIVFLQLLVLQVCNSLSYSVNH